MLWIKTFHIFFVVSWFACLFYLPRLFVNHASVTDEKELKLLTGMEQRLIKMMWFTFWGTLISAVLLVWSIAGEYWLTYTSQAWFLVKLILVTALIFYHFWCIKIHRNFLAGMEQRSHIWFRIFNEVPVFFLFAVIYLVVAKPF